MDVSPIGSVNTVSYLAAAQVGLDGPYSADKIQQTIAQVQTQMPTQAVQQMQMAQTLPLPPVSTAQAGNGSIGQVLDVSA